MRLSQEVERLGKADVAPGAEVAPCKRHWYVGQDRGVMIESAVRTGARRDHR